MFCAGLLLNLPVSFCIKHAHCSREDRGNLTKIGLPVVTCSLCASKLVSTIVSTFTAYYVHLWPTYFPDTPITPPLPSFDGRAVCYPSVQNLRDYMSWRQVDCMAPWCFFTKSRLDADLPIGHINNLYNTTFWALVQLEGMSGTEAEKFLSVSPSLPPNACSLSKSTPGHCFCQ